MKQVEGKCQILTHCELAEAAEEFRAVEIRGADAARDRKQASVHRGIAGEIEIQKRALADDRLVAFEFVSIERIVEMSLDVGNFAGRSIAPIGRPVVFPTIRERRENLVVGRKRFGGRGDDSCFGTRRFGDRSKMAARAGLRRRGLRWARQEASTCLRSRTHHPPSIECPGDRTARSHRVLLEAHKNRRPDSRIETRHRRKLSCRKSIHTCARADESLRRPVRAPRDFARFPGLPRLLQNSGAAGAAAGFGPASRMRSRSMMMIKIEYRTPAFHYHQ